MNRTGWLLLMWVSGCTSVGASTPRSPQPQAVVVASPAAPEVGLRQPSVVATRPAPVVSVQPAEPVKAEPAPSPLATCLAEMATSAVNPRHPAAQEDVKRQRAACEKGDGAACFALAAGVIASNECDEVLVRTACDGHHPIACISLALREANDGHARDVLGAVDSPLARAVEPVLSGGRAKPCPDTACVKQAWDVRFLTSRASASVDAVILRSCDERGVGCDEARMIHEETARNGLDPTSLRNFCQRHRKVCRRSFRFLHELAHNPVATALCELGDAEACGYDAMSIPGLEDAEAGPGLRGCRRGSPVACQKVSDDLLRREKVKRVTCAQKPEPCASFLKHAAAPSVRFYGMDLTGLRPEDVIPLAEEPCFRFGSPTACRILFENHRLPAAQVTARLRQACPKALARASDAQACLYLGRTLLLGGQRKDGLIALRRGCAAQHALSCLELGQALLKAGGVEVPEAISVLDAACDWNVAQACTDLADLFRSSGDEAKADAYAHMASSVIGC